VRVQNTLRTSYHMLTHQLHVSGAERLVCTTVQWCRPGVPAIKSTYSLLPHDWGLAEY
jgi:hypothetical protein